MENICEETPEEADRRRRFLLRSPAARMAEMDRLQQAWWDELQRSPEKYAEYMSRNLKEARDG